MARHTTLYTEKDEGRDKGKTFLLTEMSAAQAEEWATRLLFALSATDIEFPPGFQYSGAAAGVAEVGIKALGKMPYADASPLLTMMTEGVEFVPSPSKPNVRRPLIRDGISPDIEEVMTSVHLKFEFWKLNMGFFWAVVNLFLPDAETTASSEPPPIS